MKVCKGIVKNGVVEPLEPLLLPEDSEVLITFPVPREKKNELYRLGPNPFPVERLLALPRLKIGGDAVVEVEEVFDE